jgi:transcriptional regulator with XRE-family HTH domain
MSVQPEFTFGDYLRGFRTRQDISQASLADQLGGIHRNTINKWERGGRPKYREDVLLLETELGLSPDEIDLLLHLAGFVPKYDANVARFYSSDGVNAALPQPGSLGWS